MEGKEYKTAIEILEESFLDEYYILCKRIEGMSLSLEEFFNTDSFYISYILKKELDLMEAEKDEYEKMSMEMNNTNPKGSQTPLKQKDSENAVMFYEAYFDD